MRLDIAKTRDSQILFLTGSTGFLGSAVMAEALAQGWNVRALVRKMPLANEHSPNVEYVLGTIAQEEVLQQAATGAAAIVHTAGLAHVFGKGAQDIVPFLEVNEVGSANVVRAAVRAAVPKLVMASSVSVYGDAASDVCTEESSCKPRTAYAVSKYRAELRAAEIASGTDTDLVILRFATIYGEGDRGNVAKLVSALSRGRFIWPGQGLNRKSLIYRDDAARACLLALRAAQHGFACFNVSEDPVSMQEIVGAVCLGLQCPEPRYRIPESLLHALAACSRRLGDPGKLAHSLDKFLHNDVYPGEAFVKAFGFGTRTSLEEGIKRQIAAMNLTSRPPRNY